MNISFTLTPEDLHFFYRHHYWSSPAKKWYRVRLIGGYWVAIILFSILYSYIANDRMPNWSIYIPIMAGLGIVFSMLIRFYVLNWIKRFANKLLKENPNQDLTGERTLTFTSDGIRIKSIHTDSTFSYSIILRIEETKAYFFIYLNSAAAIVVPKNALSDNEIQSFKEVLVKANKPVVVS